MKKFQYNSPVILSFFLISLFTLALDWLSKGWTTATLFSVYRSSFTDPLTFFRLFGHILGHADLEHFFSNMLMLLVIGPPLEERYGSRVLLTGILLTGARIPLAYLLTAVPELGLNGIWWSITLSSILKGTVLPLWFLYFQRRRLR